MRKFFLFVFALVVILIGALVALPFVIPTETYQRQLEAQVQRATGRTLTIDGPVQFSIFPRLAIEVERARFANAPGAAQANMVELEILQAELKIWPLIRGSFEVDRFVLIRPVIHLEVSPDGRPNWEFGVPPPEDAAGVEEGTQPADGAGPMIPLSDVRLGDIRIEGGTLTFEDATNGASERLEALDMRLELEDMRSPFAATGSFRYKGEPVAVQLRLETPLALVQQGASRLSAGVNGPQVELAFDGEVTGAAGGSLDGAVELAVGSIRDLAAWLAEPLDAPGEGLQTLQIAGRLEAAPERIAFRDAAITLDRIESRGEVAVDLAGAVPRVSGRLDAGTLDLNPYLPPEAPEPVPVPDTAGGDGAGDAAPPDWSDEPIALPPLGGFELDFQLTVDGLQYRDITLGPSELALGLQGQTFTADLTRMNLYDGEGNGSLAVSVADGAPVIEQRFQLSGLSALPFLSDAAEFERLEGTASFELAASTRGLTERQLVENLNGSGRAAFEDGAIVGINLAAMVRNVTAAFLDRTAAEARKTDFAELSGSFRIENGRLVNDDMRLLAPALRLNGSGRVDLPARTLDYRIEPRAAATLEGQGGRADVAGILVPVVIEGPWHDLSYRPDLSGVLEAAIRDPQALREQVEQQIERLGGSKEALREALDQVDTQEGKQRLLEQLQQPGGTETLVRQFEEGGAQGLLRGLLGGSGSDGEAAGQPAPAEQQPTQDQEPPPQQQQRPEDAARQLFKGLFGN